MMHGFMLWKRNNSQARLKRESTSQNFTCILRNWGKLALLTNTLTKRLNRKISHIAVTKGLFRIAAESPKEKKPTPQ